MGDGKTDADGEGWHLTRGSLGSPWFLSRDQACAGQTEPGRDGKPRAPAGAPAIQAGGGHRAREGDTPRRPVTGKVGHLSPGL